MNKLGMIKSLCAWFCVLAIAFVAAPCAMASLLQQTVTASGISATIRMTQIGNDVRVEAHFTTPSSSSYPATCLSVYRDLRYRLTDSNNHVIAIDEKIRKNPPAFEGLVAEHTIVAKNWPPSKCYPYLHEHVAQTDTDVLYPNLPAGTYVLTATFAPRGMKDTAQLRPVIFRVARK